MNNDLISRSELTKELRERLVACNDWEEKAKDKETRIRANAVKTFICEMFMLLKELPTVSDKPQGEWIKVKEERMSIDMSGEIVTRYKCSECGRVIATFPSKLADYYPFCHCGADMRKEGAE